MALPLAQKNTTNTDALTSDENSNTDKNIAR